MKNSSCLTEAGGILCIYYPPNQEISKLLIKHFIPLQNNLMQNTFNKLELNAHVNVSIRLLYERRGLKKKKRNIAEIKRENKH